MEQDTNELEKQVTVGESRKEQGRDGGKRGDDSGR